MNDYETLREKLLCQRYRASEIPPHDGPGVYALFISDQTALPGLAVESEVLYVGMTESSLELRNHFSHSHSGFSSPRRSLGALLKGRWSLQAVPRAPGASRTNVRNYRFSDEGEQRLAAWMDTHLTYGFCPVEADVREIESRLIKELKPPLNLTGWRNPQAGQLRALRRVCCDEASSASQRRSA
jgi:GIY-YIG catalytic domain